MDYSIIPIIPCNTARVGVNVSRFFYTRLTTYHIAKGIGEVAFGIHICRVLDPPIRGDVPTLVAGR